MADAAPSPAPTLFKKRTTKTSTIRKRPATPPPDSPSSSSDPPSEDETGRIVKRRKTTGIDTRNSAIQKPTDNFKTTQYAADATSTLTKSDDSTKTAHPIGPQKAPANVRTITVTDFSPDVCKDYKQTGFCGFGDSCKFLHMRDDYKQGWELDKDWEKAGGSNKQNSKQGGGRVMASAAARRKAGMEGVIDEEDEEKLDELLEGIPFACVICKEPYKLPVTTQCGHYFCEKCALGRYKKSPTCAICGAGTGGIFNGAKNLKRLLDKKRERVKKRKEAARAAGEEVSDDEEEED